jgi:fused signal recognition particle receptor
MIFKFFRRKSEKKQYSEKELKKLLKEQKYKEVYEYLKDKYRENLNLTELYLRSLVGLKKFNLAKKIIEEVGKENLPPSLVAEVLSGEEKTLFQRFRQGLKKTREILSLNKFLGRKLDEEFLEELEEKLIKMDLGVDTAIKLVEEIREKNFSTVEEALNYLKSKFLEILKNCSQDLRVDSQPSIIMFVGINGSGKTTTVGKLAYLLKKKGKKILIVGADTFRAAAGEQLKIWADRVGVDFIGGEEGTDPGAVLYRGLKKAFDENYDVVLVDTAGRLHTKEHLLREMQKLYRVIRKFSTNQPSEVLLVLDATIGQNSINQAKMFSSAVDITGLIMTKLDATAKGGALIPICKELKIPIKFVGLGEGLEDLQPFNPKTFVEALFQ